MTGQPVNVLRELAGQVLPYVRLLHVALVANTSESSLPPGGNVSVKTDISVKCEQGETGSIVVSVLYDVLARAEGDVAVSESPDDAGEAIAWRSVSQWDVYFSPEEDSATVPRFDARQLESFAMMMGPPTVHPFAREFVQGLTGRGNYPPFTLELLTPLGALPDDEVVGVSDDFE